MKYGGWGRQEGRVRTGSGVDVGFYGGRREARTVERMVLGERGSRGCEERWLRRLVGRVGVHWGRRGIG